MAKNKKLEWFAIMEDFNKNKLQYFNVLLGIGDKEIKNLKKLTTYNDVKQELRSYLMYHYWCKSEYEVIVRSLHHRPDRDNEFKIDIWYQLEPNLDRITEYVIKELNLIVK